MNNGIHPQLSFDLARLARNEMQAQVNRDQLIREANGGRKPQNRPLAAIRRLFGGGIISLGQAVRGELVEKIDAPATSSATLRMAR